MREWPELKNTVACLAGVAALVVAGCARRTEGLTVFSAASIADALAGVASAYEAETGGPVRLNVASSGTLARQIESGAQADVFVSASSTWTRS